MKKLLLGALPICVAAALSASVAMAQDCPQNLPVVEAGKLTMSINATIPPTQYINDSGEIVGQNRELGDAIAKRLCLEPVYQNVDFAVQIPGLDANRWDMINTGLYFTEERTKTMHLIPYSVNALALIAADGNPLAIDEPKDLAGHPVGVEIAGFEEKKLKEINDQQIAEGLAPMDVRVFNSYGEAFLALGGGQVSAVFAGDVIGTYYQKQGKFTKAATGLYPGTPGAFAVDEPALAQAVADALNAMKADGTYAAILDSYGTTQIDVWDKWPGEFAFYYTGN